MLELRAEEVCKRFGEKRAVDRVSFALSSGVYGLLGENGAGKTTLMRMLCALLRPDSGTILFQGENVRQMGAQYRRILGYLPQDFGYYPDFTAERYLRYLAQLKALPPWMVPQKLDEIWELTGLKDAKRQRLKSFSGGMLRRLGIGQALLNDPQVLVLDEPTAGLDPKERIRFRNMISSLGKDRIVLLSTHIVQDVEFIADRIMMMKGGKLAESGTVWELSQKVEGKVWECLVDEAWAERIAMTCAVSNLRRERDQIYMRVISDEKPVPDAWPGVPNLEDIYLFFAGERREYGTVFDGTV